MKTILVLMTARWRNFSFNWVAYNFFVSFSLPLFFSLFCFVSLYLIVFENFHSASTFTHSLFNFFSFEDSFIHFVSSLMTYFDDEYLPLECTFSKSVSLSFVRSLIHRNHINFNFVLVFIRFCILALCRFQFWNDFFLMSF